MASLSTATRALARSSALRSTTRTAALSTSAVARGDASASNPFTTKVDTKKVPDFSKYMSKGSSNTNQLISYFMVGTLGAISAAGAKDTVQGEWDFYFLGKANGKRDRMQLEQWMEW